MRSWIDLEAVWQDLRDDSIGEHALARRRVLPDAPLDIFLAMEKPANRPLAHLELSLADVEALPSFEVSGLSVHAELMDTKGPGHARCVLEPPSRESWDLFLVVVDDLVVVAADAGTREEAVGRIAGRLDEWQRFFTRSGPDGLSVERQLGFYGEIWWLRELLKRPKASVESWVGPFAANQDFQNSSRAVEVKTTSANPVQRIRISNLLQLDDAGLDRLALAVIEVSKVANSPESLPQAVAEVRLLAAGAGAAQATALEDRLLASGYHDAHAARYQAVGYSVRSCSCFEVHDSFPRILEGDVSSGVGDVRYSLVLAAAQPFKIETESVLAWLAEHDATD